MQLLDQMIDEESSIITLIYGADVGEEEIANIQGMIEEKYADLDLDVRNGQQPVYSFLIGVE